LPPCDDCGSGGKMFPAHIRIAIERNEREGNGGAFLAVVAILEVIFGVGVFASRQKPRPLYPRVKRAQHWVHPLNGWTWPARD
jgi:hypothetical protein